jgi:hypothetical protein
MNIRSGGAVLLVLLWTSSFALAADGPIEPAKQLMFPESVERAMMGEAAMANRTNHAEQYSLTITGGTLDLVDSRIWELIDPQPKPPQSQSERAQRPLPVAPSAPSMSSESTTFYAEIVTLLEERKLAEAIVKMHGSRELPIPPSEFVFLYEIFRRTSHRDTALAFLERAVVETPTDPEPWVILGDIAVADNRFAEAELDFDKAKQLLPSYKNAKLKKAIELGLTNGAAQLAERRKHWKSLLPPRPAELPHHSD